MTQPFSVRVIGVTYDHTIFCLQITKLDIRAQVLQLTCVIFDDHFTNLPQSFVWVSVYGLAYMYLITLRYMSDSD